MDKFQTYRQPFVTATGILLGFMLNFGITTNVHDRFGVHIDGADSCYAR